MPGPEEQSATGIIIGNGGGGGGNGPLCLITVDTNEYAGLLYVEAEGVLAALLPNGTWQRPFVPSANIEQHLCPTDLAAQAAFTAAINAAAVTLSNASVAALVSALQGLDVDLTAPTITAVVSALMTALQNSPIPVTAELDPLSIAAICACVQQALIDVVVDVAIAPASITAIETAVSSALTSTALHLVPGPLDVKFTTAELAVVAASLAKNPQVLATDVCVLYNGAPAPAKLVAALDPVTLAVLLTKKVLTSDLTTDVTLAPVLNQCDCCETVEHITSMRVTTNIDSISGTGTGQTGEVITYLTELCNTGTVKLTGLVVTTTNSVQTSGPVAVLNPQQCVLKQSSHVITSAEAGAGLTTNRSQVTATSPSGSSEFVSTLLNLPIGVSPAPLLFVTQTRTGISGTGTGLLGETISYAYGICNKGTAAAINISVVDFNAVIAGGPISLTAGVCDFVSFTSTHVITADDITAGSVVNISTAIGTGLAGDISSPPSVLLTTDLA